MVMLFILTLAKYLILFKIKSAKKVGGVIELPPFSLISRP